MPVAEIITIGTELLLGEIPDTNTQYVARQLREAGIDLYWTSTVGDNEARIAEAARHALSRANIVICTGGLGPTVDDVTRTAIARALDSHLVFHPELWEQIKARFARFARTPSDNNRFQAYVPKDARVLENAIGSAPAFLVEKDGKVIISMPGVPSEMKYIMDHGVLPYFKERFGSTGLIRARVLHIAGVPESQIDEKIADLEKLSNPTVGLAAHAGEVDVRLTAKAGDEKGVQVMLDDLEKEVRSRLGQWIYGVDEETLARVVLKIMVSRKETLAVIEKGLNGALVKALTGEGNAFVGGEILNANLRTSPLNEMAPQYAQNVKAAVVLGAELRSANDKNELEIAIHGLRREHHYEFSYGGHTSQAPEWAVNLALSILRLRLLEENA